MAGVDDELNPGEPRPPDDIPEFDEPSEDVDISDTLSAPLPWEEGYLDFQGVPERDPNKPEGMAPLGFEPEGGGEPVPKIPEAPPAPPDLEEFDQAANARDRDEIGFQTMPESAMEPLPEAPATWKPRQRFASRQQKAQATRTARRQRMGLEGLEYDEDAQEAPGTPFDAGGVGGLAQTQNARQEQGGGLESATQMLQEILQAIQESNEKLGEIADKLDDVGTYGT